MPVNPKSLANLIPAGNKGKKYKPIDPAKKARHRICFLLSDSQLEELELRSGKSTINRFAKKIMVEYLED